MLIGLQLYEADPATAKRQQGAVRALRALNGVEAVNLQFRDGPPTVVPEIETAALLTEDSVAVTGVAGRRRPLTREIFDRLAALAASRGHDHFAFINSDIQVTSDAIAVMEHAGRETYAISRSDVDLVTGALDAGGPLTAGIDMFVASPAWWMRHRKLFRPYIVGEACWDNVYAAILMCHSDGLLLNREPLIMHERHPPVWHDEAPAARYNGMLAALDARYFSLWVRYWHRLERLRVDAAPADREDALRREVFVWRRSLTGALRQFATGTCARLRYRELRAGWLPVSTGR